MSKMPPFPIKWMLALCLTGVSTFGSSANAACASSAPGIVTCSGVSPITYLNNGSSPALQNTVILDGTYQVTTATGAAFNIDNTTAGFPLNLQQDAGGFATGPYGFMVQTDGSVSETLNGDVTGSSASGVAATVRTAGTDLSINQVQGTISGQSTGITTWNQGTGLTSITTSGKVVSAGGTAVTILNQSSSLVPPLTSSATSLTVNQTAGEITGATGISATNYGTGPTKITTTTNVTGTNGSGVTSAAMNDLTITQTSGVIDGYITGIGANGLGAGAVSIDVLGTVKASGPPSDDSGVGVFATANSTSGGKVTLNQAAGTSISGTNWGIGLNQFGTLSGIEFNTQGTIIGGAGGGIYTGAILANNTPVILNINNGANISSTGPDNIAIEDQRGQAQLTLFSGSVVNGHIHLGRNNDTMLVMGGAVISDPTSDIDGGDSLYGVDLLGATTSTNKLTFQGGTLTRAGATILNWQTITLDGTPTELTDSLLNTGTGTNPDGSLQGLLLRNAAKVTLQPEVKISGDVSIDPGTSMNHSLGGAVKGAVTNGGVVTWVHPAGPPASYSRLSNTSYIGVSGQLVMNTFLGVDGSASDVLAIDGGTGTGTTTLNISNTDGPGALTTGNGILVVDALNGATTVPGAFALASRLIAGEFEYKLYRGSVDASNPEAWYLRSVAVPKPPIIPPTPVPGLRDSMLWVLGAVMLAVGYRRRLFAPAKNKR